MPGKGREVAEGRETERPRDRETEAGRRWRDWDRDSSITVRFNAENVCDSRGRYGLLVRSVRNVSKRRARAREYNDR